MEQVFQGIRDNLGEGEDEKFNVRARVHKSFSNTYIFESTRDYAKYNGMIVLSQILGRLKSGTAKDRYDKNCTRFPMQRVLNVKKETLLCSIRGAFDESKVSLLGK